MRETNADGLPHIVREDMADKLTGHANGAIGRDYGRFPIVDLAAAVRRVPGWF